MRVRKTIYNDEQMTNSNSLARAMLQNPAKLSPVMTYLGGREDKKFPLTLLTEGVGNTTSIDRDEYEYNVQTRINKTRPLAETPSSTSGVGRGGAMFTLTFPDRWFIKDYVLISESGVQVRIMEQPTPNGDNYDYTCQLVDPNESSVVPSSDLQAGSTWGQMFAPVGKDFSRGNASNWTAPAKVRHKLTKIRKSYEMSGDANDYVIDIELPQRGGGTTNMWMDHEEWQHWLSWKEEMELLYWYGEKSYDSSGTTHLTDERGQPVVIGPGLFQQIINKDTYSNLTATKLHNVIGDLFYGMTDAQEVQVTLFTGTGGMREFDAALKDETNNLGFTVLDQGRFVRGQGSDLEFGGYFRTYQHVDGHTINVVKNPLFDQSAVADARAQHPQTGYSLESYRMVFVDQSTYEGENNVQMINKEGREMLRWSVAGSVVPRGFQGNADNLRATDIDGASVHFMKQCGICLKRFDTSLDLQCVAA